MNYSLRGKGFTKVDEARRFVAENGLRLAFGGDREYSWRHFGRIQRPEKNCRLPGNLEHLESLFQTTGVPLVLHGGSG